MRTRSTLSVLVLSLATLVGQSTVTMAATIGIEPANCRLPFVDNRASVPPSTVRIGWPLPQERIPGNGLQKILILPIDFSDAPSKETPESLISKVVKPEVAKKFYSLQSNGSLTLQFDNRSSVHRMQNKSEEYGFWNKNKTGWGLYSDKFGSEMGQVLKDLEPTFTYSSLVILVTGGSAAWKSWGVPGVANTYPDSYGAYGQLNLKNVIFLIDNDGSNLDWTFVHELGHLLGFVDLYSSGYMADSTGPFDVMAHHWEKSRSLLGWNLWLKGWIKDSQVVCLDYRSQANSEISLSPLIGNGETRLIVIKESANSAIVIEARRDTEYDSLGKNAGLLVYRIKPNALWPERYVQIIPHNNAITSRGISPDFSDTERFLSAPVTEGMYLRNLGLLIENKKQSNSEILTQLFWFSNADTRQREIDNKLKAIADKELADRKAKEELDAKTAAELKAKQELDAKTAAELKAKQDAAVNALLADSQKLILEQAAKITSLEEQFRVLSESVGGFQGQVSQLNSKLTAALASLKSANAKIKKICAVKPKPKGC